MVGKIISELVMGKEPSVSLEYFKPDRFVTNKIHRELL
jgi:hypothetical protein